MINPASVKGIWECNTLDYFKEADSSKDKIDIGLQGIMWKWYITGNYTQG